MSSDIVLPSELWAHIANFCRQRDLHLLSLLNWRAHCAVRSILFRKVVIRLRWVKRNFDLVQNLLQGDESPFQSALQVRIVEDDFNPREDTCNMVLELLCRLKRAHTMILTDWPFLRYSECEERFLEVMCTGQWKSFSYPWEEGRPYYLLNFDDLGWEAVRGLTHITFGTAHLLNGARKFIQASASTVTHLTFSKVLDVTDAGELTGYINIKTIFPHLLFFECTINTGLFGPHTLWERSSLLITRFLTLHPTIQHLQLHCAYDECVADHDCVLYAALIGEEFLPDLRIIETHVNALSTMAYQGVKSLATVEEVIARWTRPNDPDVVLTPIDHCLSNISHRGGFPNVKRFTLLSKTLKFQSSESSRITIRQMETLAGLLSSVEEWTGEADELQGAAEDEIIGLFKPFSGLRTVRLLGALSSTLRTQIENAMQRGVATLQYLYLEDLTST